MGINSDPLDAISKPFLWLMDIGGNTVYKVDTVANSIVGSFYSQPTNGAAAATCAVLGLTLLCCRNTLPVHTPAAPAMASGFQSPSRQCSCAETVRKLTNVCVMRCSPGRQPCSHRRGLLRRRLGAQHLLAQS